MARVRISFVALLGSIALVLFVLLLNGPHPSASAALADLPRAALISLPCALAAFLLRVVSPSGALAGLLVSSLLLAGAGWAAWLQLGLALGVTATVTKLGSSHNAASGTLDDRNGRGWRNVIANTGLAAGAALFAHDPASAMLANVGVAAVLATGAGDTAASELGKAFGRQTISMFPIRSVPPGTPGAVSVVGTVAGVASAGLLAVCAGATHLVPSQAVPVVAIAAVAALLFDGVIAELLESRGWLDNDGVNLMATCAAGASAIVVCMFTT